MYTAGRATSAVLQLLAVAELFCCNSVLLQASLELLTVCWSIVFGKLNRV